MPLNPGPSDAELKELVQFILALKQERPGERVPGTPRLAPYSRRIRRQLETGRVAVASFGAAGRLLIRAPAALGTLRQLRIQHFEEACKVCVPARRYG